ncbi:GNAT family N-acetyltransferase [bacterium]|nr:GNAT family N-acetyltransferase [bacterium]
MSVTIIPFEPKYAGAFKELNIAWLEKYFYVEPKDEILLENCKKSIIDRGGYIFFAKIEDKIVGCFSFIKLDSFSFELGKMAVCAKHQGQKIGQILLQFAIAFAEQNGWRKISLYSSTKLPTALHIYKKFGFVDVELEKDLPYARSDVKMELSLVVSR